MTQQIINTGIADAGNGDPLRTAFTKVNANFTELFNQVSAVVTANATAPDNPEEGDLWWDAESGRLYVYYGSTWVDASPVDGAGISSTNELVNGAHTVSLDSTGVLTLPDGLTIDNSVIGYSTSDTITEETINGTISQTTSYQNQIIVDTTDAIRIANIITQTVDDGVVTTTDSTGSTIDVDGTGVSIKKYVEPDGPNNGSYFQVSTTNSGAIIEGVEEDLAGNTYGRVTATQGVVAVNTAAGGIDKEWAFTSDGELFVPEASTIMGTNDLTIKSQVAGNSSGLYLNGNTLLGTAMLYAHSNATIRTDYDGNVKDWNFDTSGTLTTPSLLPRSFTATVDSDHYVEQTPGVGLALTDDAWYFEVEFVVASNGSIETQITNNTPWASNPGYQNDMQFAFTEADHGIPGYTFTLTLTDIQNPGMFMYTTNLAASIAPTLPATISNPEAVKITADATSWTFGADGSLTLPGSLLLPGSIGIEEDDGSLYMSAPDNIILSAGNDQTGSVFIKTNQETKEWEFGADGDLILPGKITATIDQSIQLESKSNVTTPGQEITAADNQGLGSSDFITVWIEGSGGTDYPEIVAVQPGWTVSGPGLTNDIITNVETIVYAPGMSVYRITTTTTSDKDGYSYIFTEPATLSVETNTWTFGTNGDLSMPNGLTVYGGIPTLAVATGNNLGISTSRVQFESAVAVIGSGPMTFVADISENDDITVVEAGWTVDVGGTTYTVTSVDDTTPGLFIIAVLNATFQVGQSYTFDNPVPVSSTWVFGNDGVLTTPASGSISHLNNDLKLEVTGTDVIVLRTAGGDVYVDASGTLNANGIVTSYLNFDNQLIQVGQEGGGRFSVAMDRFQVLATAPTSSIGSEGDVIGCVAFDADYIYYCSGLYDGTTDIWKRVAWSGDTW